VTQEFYAAHADEGLTVIVSLTETDSTDDLAAWIEEFGVTHDVGGDYERKVWDAYNHLSIGRPQYIVIDRSFTVVKAGNLGTEAEEFAAGLL
jgi:hypothetical protein